jgi:hypothetical protein
LPTYISSKETRKGRRFNMRLHIRATRSTYMGRVSKDQENQGGGERLRNENSSNHAAEGERSMAQ